jgi:hypothetical protein
VKEKMFGGILVDVIGIGFGPGSRIHCFIVASILSASIRRS